MSGSTVALAAGTAIVLVLLTLLGLGVISLPWFGPEPPSTAGLIPVPTPARAIPPYARIRRDDLWDAANQRFSVVYLPPRAVTGEMLTDITRIIGRVLDGEKAPGYVFTEDDFLPLGTREGLVAGIPAGKRAVRISADRVEGLFGLRMGDRFDLLATMPIDAERSGGQSFAFSGPYASQLALQAQMTNWSKQATVRVIVQNALIVEPMNPRGVTALQGSLADGAAARVRAVQEAVIAIDPEEVAPLTEALAVEARLMTVPRSGRPDDPPDSETPELQPFAPFSSTGTRGRSGDDFEVVETIMGQRRELAAVPRP